MNDAPVYRFSVVSSSYPQNVVILTYNYVGRLVDMTFGADCTDGLIHTAKAEAPVRVVPRQNGQLPRQFDAWLAARCRIKDISNFDLSFEKFWTAYGNKVGDVKRVRRKWESLPELDRIMALGFIPRMRNYYDGRGIVFPFPETYLNQRRWENVLN
jgi:hypothetical protein